MDPDARSRQVAVVADSRLPALLGLLEEECWGVIQLPPDELDETTAGLWLEQVAEHVAEFRRNDYAVVLLDGGRAERLETALAELGEPVPPSPADEDVRAFLRRHALRVEAPC